MANVAPETLPFDEAIQFFRQKVNLPTASWTDLWEGMHARAFVVAGAIKEDLLTDFRQAIDQAISQRTGYDEFRQQFRQIVKKHGWSYNGGEGWRSRVIYTTNIRSAHMSGRYRQMQKLKKQRPWWQYKHSDLVQHPRLDHLAWDNLVLSADDPWWETHFPPNGWGCQCRVYARSDRDLQRLGLRPGQAPKSEMVTETVGVRGPNPRQVETPAGIDPGFAYNPGQAAFGRQLSDDAMRAWQARQRQQWQRLDTRSYRQLERPVSVPIDEPVAALGPDIESPGEAADEFRALFNGDEIIIKTPAMPVHANAESLGRHLDLNRSAFFPYLVETLEDPYEVWLSFERHKGTGQVVLDSRYIKSLAVPGADPALVIAHARGGQFLGWSWHPDHDRGTLNAERQGYLLYARDTDGAR